MKRALVILFFSTVATAVYCQRADSFKWLAGNWKIKTQQGQVIESWELVNDSLLQGRSIFVKPTGDTIPQEKLELSFRNGQWYYIATVPGQNNNQPVLFKLIYQRGLEFIAENPTHDFPQRIAYRRIKEQLFASIEGKKKGTYNKQNFDYTAE